MGRQATVLMLRHQGDIACYQVYHDNMIAVEGIIEYRRQSNDRKEEKKVEM